MNRIIVFHNLLQEVFFITEPELPMKRPEKPKDCAKDSDCKPGEFCEMIVISPFITLGTCQPKLGYLSISCFVFLSYTYSVLSTF